MDSNFFKHTFIGAVAFFVLGYLIYGLALMGYFAENTTGGQETPVWWALAVSQIGLGAILATVLGAGSARDFASGAKAAGMVGIMYGLAVSFDLLATTTMFNSTTPAVVMVLTEAVRFAVAGGIVAMMMGKE